MRIHYYEVENAGDKSHQDVDRSSWATCGKSISNKAITISELAITCATCLKILAKAKTQARAA